MARRCSARLTLLRTIRAQRELKDLWRSSCSLDSGLKAEAGDAADLHTRHRRSLQCFMCMTEAWTAKHEVACHARWLGVNQVPVQPCRTAISIFHALMQTGALHH